MIAWQQFLQDGDGRFSSSRLVNLAVCLAAIVICGVLTWGGEMSEGYFAALLAYGAGVHSYNKYVETRTHKAEELK